MSRQNPATKDRKEEFECHFDLEASRQRVTEFREKYPALTSAINDYKSKVSEEAKKEYSNPDDVADFCVSEILHLSREWVLNSGEKVFSNSEITEMLAKLSSVATTPLIQEIAKLVKSNPNDLHLAVALADYLINSTVETEKKDGLELAQTVAEKGYAPAQLLLGDYYRKPNEKEAINLYQMAAKQGLAPAQYELGHANENPVETAKLYQAAADRGHMSAQLRLGILYRTGVGVKKNLTKAAEFYKMAADQKVSGAREVLADILFDYQGDSSQAILLYSLSTKEKRMPELLEEHRREIVKLLDKKHGEQVATEIPNAPTIFSKEVVMNTVLNAAGHYDTEYPESSADLESHVVHKYNDLNKLPQNQNVVMPGQYVLRVIESDNNTPLTRSEIFEVISALQKTKVRKNDREDSLIGDLVRVSKDSLDLTDLAAIRQKHLQTNGSRKSLDLITSTMGKKIKNFLGRKVEISANADETFDETFNIQIGPEPSTFKRLTSGDNFAHIAEELEKIKGVLVRDASEMKQGRFVISVKDRDLSVAAQSDPNNNSSSTTEGPAISPLHTTSLTNTTGKYRGKS